MRGSGVVRVLVGMLGVVVCEPLYCQRLDAVDEMRSLEDCPTPTPGLVRPTVLGTRQLDSLLDRHGGIKQQLREVAESLGYQQRLLQGRRREEREDRGQDLVWQFLNRRHGRRSSSSSVFW